jgi:hypothetical protein
MIMSAIDLVERFVKVLCEDAVSRCGVKVQPATASVGMWMGAGEDIR